MGLQPKQSVQQSGTIAHGNVIVNSSLKPKMPTKPFFLIGCQSKILNDDW